MTNKITNIYAQKKKRLKELKKTRRSAGLSERVCKKCGTSVEISLLKASMYICPECGGYFSMSPQKRLRLVCDEKSFREMYGNLTSEDPIDFPDYKQKLEELQEKLGQKDAIVTGVASIDKVKVAIGVLDGRFLMGSMGTVVGEKIVRLAEYAKSRKLPLILFSASGGARMQEGLFSLMQMAKTSAAIEAYKNAGGLFISVLTNPTTGGVSASYASLGDVIIAEPDALICFAGPRVIEQTIGQKLPEGFQRAEFLLEHGMIDKIVERKDLKRTLSRLLWGRFPASFLVSQTSFGPSPRRGEPSPASRLQQARDKSRPGITDYISNLFTDFVEFHGDRLFRDDPSILGGIAYFRGVPVTVIGHRKGKTTEENIKYNFGMTSPEGYRKARRLMEQAEKFGRPIITFVDTPGAYPGIEAESNGQSNAIAENLALMSRLTVPIITIITGEGSSGGALAIAVSDLVLMMENSVYSILSPEGFASILWKDRSRAAEACEIMKITAYELCDMGIVDGVICEDDHMYRRIDQRISEDLARLLTLKPRDLVKERYRKFRQIDGLYRRR